MNTHINNKITAVHDKMSTDTFYMDSHAMKPIKIGTLNYLSTFYSASCLNQSKLSQALFSAHHQRGIKQKLKLAISMCCRQLLPYFLFTYKVGMVLLMTYTPNTKCISHSHPHPAVEHIHIGSCTQLLCTAVDTRHILPVAHPKVRLLINQNRHMAFSSCPLVYM